MFRKSGNRFSEQDMRETKEASEIDGHLGTFTIEWLKAIKADHERWVRDSLPGYAVDVEGKITKTAGTPLADILKLPEAWPRPDDRKR